MTKCFLDDEIDQSLMMPPSLHDWLPEDHLARFVADLVPSFDLWEFYASYEEKDGRGQAAYHPVMMVRLLIYRYCIGVVSSRQIEKRTYEDVALPYLSADEHPDHTTINEFRKRHFKALSGLLLQALHLCQAAGLVKIVHVALDGTKKQPNFTDPDSRIMPDGAHKGSFVQAYNAQIAVDAEAQIIVAAEVTQEANDKQQLAPMLEQVQQNTGVQPVASSEDAGYWSPEQVADKRVAGIDLHVATGRDKHGIAEETAPSTDATTEATALNQMKQKLQTEAGRAIYKMRKAIVEPVFGQIKECRNFRRFSLRGLKNVRAEWKLVCLTHNILKLFRSGRRLQTAAA